MEHFESTKTLMELLEKSKYQRPVIENDEEKIDFEKVFENYKEYTSRSNNHEYFTCRTTEVGN